MTEPEPSPFSFADDDASTPKKKASGQPPLTSPLARPLPTSPPLPAAMPAPGAATTGVVPLGGFAVEPEPAKPKRQVPLPIAAAPVAAKPSPRNPAPVDENPDIKPGSRQDLWTCPHCGTKCRPDRTTCRSCEKSPDEPVITPWHAKPLVWAGIAAGVVALIALIVMFSRPNLELHPASDGRADRRVRSGGSPRGGEVRLDSTRIFVPERRIAVTGRVLAVRPVAAGGTLVVLALGGMAEDNSAFATLKPKTSGAAVVVDNAGDRDWTAFVVFKNNHPPTTRGSWLALTGDAGTVTSDGGQMISELSDLGPAVITDAMDIH